LVPSGNSRPPSELFFVLESFQACFAEYVTAFRPLFPAADRMLANCSVYYREDTDVALLALRFEPSSMDHTRLSELLDFAASAGLAALDPAMLPDDDRQRFYERYLEEYPLRAEGQQRPEEALVGLAETLGLRAVRPRQISKNVLPPKNGRRAGTAPKGPPPPPARARERTATWDGASRSPPAVAAPPPPPVQAPQLVAEDQSNPTLLDEPHPFSRAASPVPPVAHEPTATGSGKSPAQGPRRYSSRPPGVRAVSPPPAPGTTTSPEPISVRFRRGDEWAPARLRSLGLKGAYLACTAPPRLHDEIHIALGLGSIGTVMRGTVVHVTSAQEATNSGSGGFGVLFPEVESPARSQLRELLAAARRQGITLQPPPPRSALRFPVRWPVQILLPDRSGLDIAALDMSIKGMFLSTLAPLPRTPLDFHLPTESGARIRGRLRAVRAVPWKLACARGLHSGFGMEIIEFAPDDHHRYAGFVDRVGQRVQRRVLVGASPERSEKLVAGLAAAGYTVSGASDANTIIQLGECDPRPPDAALLDASLAVGRGAAQRIEAVLAARRVPVISIAGEPAHRARAVVDNLLAVHTDA
jgi:hypothetical protein